MLFFFYHENSQIRILDFFKVVGYNSVLEIDFVLNKVVVLWDF